MGRSNFIHTVGLLMLLQSPMQLKQLGSEVKSRLGSLHLDNIPDTVIHEDEINVSGQSEDEFDLGSYNENCQNVSVTHCRCSSSYNATVQMNCSNGHFTHVPNDIPWNTVVLLLSHNDIEDISVGAFQNLTHLKILDLSNNKIARFSEGVFKGLTRLEILYIQDNEFQLKSSSFDDNVFLDLVNLRELNIKSRFLSPSGDYHYPDEALSKLSSLETLIIDGLNYRTFGDGFQNMSSLKVLNLSQTSNFTDISGDMFHNFKYIPVQKLLLNNCELRYIHPHAFEYFTKIDTIDYSHNTALGLDGVSESLFGLQNSTIRTLVVRHINPASSFTQITADHTRYLKNTQLEELYVDNNTIVGYSKEAVDNIPKSLKILSIAWNNIQTKRQQIQALFVLQNITEVNFSYQETFQLYREGENNSTLDHAFLPKMMANLASSSKHQPLTSVGFGIPPKLWRIECSNTYKLHFQIPSLTILNNSVKYADFSNNLMYHWAGPVYGLVELEYLDLSGNSCNFISPNFFGYLPKLKTLRIARNRLGPELRETIFSNLTSLKILNIHDNIQEKTLPGLFSKLVDLEELDMSSNFLTSWEAGLSGLTKLVRLNLANNKFTSLPPVLCEGLDEIAKQGHIQVDLRGNHLQCICATIDFVSWFAQTQVDFIHLNSTLCRLENGTNVSLKHKPNIQNHLRVHCRSYTTLISVTSACFGVCLVTLICYLFHRNRWRIRYLLYNVMNKKQRTGYQTLDGDVNESLFYFDAFVSYADSSRRFIIEEFIPRVEKEGKLKLCIDKRNFVPGQYVTDNIMNAIRNSKKTVVLLTREFLRSKWCMYELNMARMEEIYTGRQLLTVVLLEEIPTKDYARHVLDLFVRQTYIEKVEDEYGAQLFWQKLISSIQDDTYVHNPAV